MADLKKLQKSILDSTAPNTIVHAFSKTGKTTLLARKYLNILIELLIDEVSAIEVINQRFGQA